jgi:hypothetical protein
MTNESQRKENTQSPFGAIWVKLSAEARVQMYGQALTARANLEKSVKTLSVSTADTYKKALVRLAGKEAALRSRSTLRVVRAALTLKLKESVLTVPISDAETLCAAVFELFTFVRCIQNTADILGGQICENQAFLRLGQWLASNGIQVLGPEQVDFRARVGRVSRIRKYPQDWRERLLGAVQTGIPNMKGAVLVLALTGCRPSELISAELSICDTGIKITVESAKSLRGEEPTRRGGIYLVSQMTSALVPLAEKGGRPFAKINYKALDNLLQRTSQKKGVLPSLLKISVRSSDFRNQLAADAKAVGWPPEDIALLLGHISTLQQKAYGRSYLGRRSSFFLPANVIQSHAVRSVPLAYSMPNSSSQKVGGSQKTKLDPDVPR